MSQEKQLEFKVGMFVLAALTALTIFIFSITDNSIFEKGQDFKVIFNFANGLKKSAPVRIAGVDEGIVKDVYLFFDRADSMTKAEVIIWVKSGVKIPKDSIVMVNQLGLMGEKYLEILPGVDTKEFYNAGDVLIGREPVAIALISERMMSVADKVEETIGGVNAMITDEENVKRLEESLANFSNMTGNMNDILVDVKSGKGTVGKLLYDSHLYDDLEGMTSDLRKNPWKLLYKPSKNEN
jgi:phospholipid/cholesterol/gamma-HCH transport system substrate-binding protein